MSASNWAVCPRCLRRSVDEQEAAMARLTAAGLNDGSFTLTVRPAGPTFREDYEIHGADRGTVKVSYGGTCEACGLSVEFDHEHEIPGVDE